MNETPPARNTFRWEWEKGECFAFKGVSMLGCIDRYECGVLLPGRYRLQVPSG